MKECKNCGRKLDNDTYIICPYCGYRLKEYREPLNIGRPPIVLVGIGVMALLVSVIVGLVKNDDTPTINRYEQYSKELNGETTKDTGEQSDKNTSEQTEKQTTDNTKKKESKATLSKYLGKKQAKKVKKLLRKKIGFSSVTFKGKDDELEIYNFDCDGQDIIVMAYTDEISAVYTKDRNYTLYMDGKVKMTAKELSDAYISWEDWTRYEIIAKDTVKMGLVNSARFKDSFRMKRKDNLVTVQSTVESKNTFNAWVAEKFTVQFYDHGDFDYDIQYVKIGDEKVGQYIK